MDTRYLLRAATLMAIATMGCAETAPTAPSSTLLSGAVLQLRTVSSPNQPIRIVQGAIVLDLIDFATRSISLRGTRGFTFEGGTGDGRYPGAHCVFEGCVPGSTISLHGFWVAPDVGGVAFLQGKQIRGFEDEEPQALAIELFSEVTAPPQAVEATVTAPFRLEGLIGWDSGSATLEGQGTVTATLQWLVDSWRVSSVRYEFRGGGPAR